jgi:hypothetical protein
MKKLLLIPIVALLAGCNSSGPKVLTTPVLQDRPKFSIPDPSPASQSNINWIVLTRDNAKDKIAELEKSQGVISVFALTPQGYQNLSINVAELRRYIQQQNSTIKAIKEYYETPVGSAK